MIQHIKGFIHNWRVVSPDPFRAPEINNGYIMGFLFDSLDGDDGDGEPICTSLIVKPGNTPCTIVTFSGSIYQLGNPEPAYVEWCKEKGCHIPTAEEPIKWKE